MADVQKVVIVGGGVGGCAVALAFRQAGAEVEIHETYDDFQGRATGFSIWAYAIKRLLDFGFDRFDSEVVVSSETARRRPPCSTMARPRRATS